MTTHTGQDQPGDEQLDDEFAPYFSDEWADLCLGMIHTGHETVVTPDEPRQTPTTTEQGIPQGLLPGARLRNGAVVLDVKAIPGNLFVVLARIEGVHPFVTWLAENADHTYWGHYRLGYGEAVADFRRRT